MIGQQAGEVEDCEVVPRLQHRAGLELTRIAEPLAERLGMSVEEAALGALQIQKYGMAQAIELNSVRRGYDPREFTLVAAGGYDFLKHRALFSAEHLAPLAVGLVVSFISAFVVIRWLIRYVATHDFKPFAWYRIVFGVIVLLTAYFGWVDWKA